MMLGRSYGDDVNGRVKEASLLNGVHAGICGGAVNEKL